MAIRVPAHPDTIPDLEPDCRRVLRLEYSAILVAEQKVERGIGRSRDINRGESAKDYAEACAAVDKERQRALNAAIAEYVCVAILWGIEV
jgi:hypothetical protein